MNLSCWWKGKSGPATVTCYLPLAYTYTDIKFLTLNAANEYKQARVAGSDVAQKSDYDGK